MCIYTRISLHLTTLTSECIPLEKSLQWSLACVISFGRDAWMRTSNNRLCQNSKFLPWLHKNKIETHESTRYFKNQWKSALSLLPLTLPCVIPSPREPRTYWWTPQSCQSSLIRFIKAANDSWHQACRPHCCNARRPAAQRCSGSPAMPGKVELMRTHIEFAYICTVCQKYF